MTFDILDNCEANIETASLRVTQLEDEWSRLFALSPDLFCTMNSQGFLNTTNPAFEKELGFTIDELNSKSYFEFIHPEERVSVIETWDNLVNGQNVSGYPVRFLCKDGTYKWFSWIASFFQEKQLIYAIGRNINSLKVAEEILHQKTNLLRLIERIGLATNVGMNSEEVIQLCLEQVCLSKNWPVGHAYFPAGDSSKILVPSTLWHVESPERFEMFRSVTDAVQYTQGIGLPGRVFDNRKPEWISDLSKDKKFERACLSADIGLHSAFAFPVLVGQKVVCVLEFFSYRVEEPDQSLFEMMHHVNLQLGSVLQRK